LNPTPAFHPDTYPGYEHRRTLGYDAAVSAAANAEIQAAKSYVFATPSDDAMAKIDAARTHSAKVGMDERDAFAFQKHFGELCIRGADARHAAVHVGAAINPGAQSRTCRTIGEHFVDQHFHQIDAVMFVDRRRSLRSLERIQQLWPKES